MTSGIRDNLKHGTVGAYLREILSEGAEVSIVSAYFTIYAFDALRQALERVDRVRFLFGEPRFVSQVSPATEAKHFVIRDEGLDLQKNLQQDPIAKACADWIARKVEVRSVKQNSLLHGKLYHVQHPGGREDAILGSSNFTLSGLGLASDGRNNIELNLVVNDQRDHDDLRAWFDDLWNDKTRVEDVKGKVLHYMAQLYRNHAPEFIYYKTLYHVFAQFLAEQADRDRLTEQGVLVETAIWRALYAFQKDGVKGAINKINTHGGCIIADSVGLGKTFEALAVIKYFELRNDRVLVLCPKKLRENWTVYQASNNSTLNPFLEDRFGYTVLSHTDLSRESGMAGDVDLATFHWGNYDLVVVDESHNFRNNRRGRRNEDGHVIRKSRYERLMEDIIQSGRKTRVLLLSATPVNNNLKDLRNQIALLTGGRDDAFAQSLRIKSVQDALAYAQRTFTEWTKHDKTRDTRRLLERLNAAFFTLLDALTIARSRKHIERYYAASVVALGGFPERAKPVAVYADIDRKGYFMSYDKLHTEIGQYKLALFNPSAYVMPEYQHHYEDDARAVAAFTQRQREYYLIGMMRVNFLKRLESSIEAFRITMQRTLEKIEALLARIARFRALQADEDFDVEDLDIDALDDEDLQAALQVGTTLKYQMAHLDLDAWEATLREDLRQIALLHASARDVTPERDAKLAELKGLIAEKVTHPTTNTLGQPNRKVLVFTAFADTAHYLYTQLEAWARDELGIHIAMVTGGTHANQTTLGSRDFHHILTNFSPVAKQRDRMRGMPREAQIDLLIATDCVSEGQNLQDCDYLINYDIHWNPVRIIQRFGRIDRIGSICPRVQLVNFWPMPDLNKYINLKNRVEARMALVDVAATMEDNLLAPDDVPTLVEAEMSYRDHQLLRLQDEILDLEDFDESVALDAFTLDDFRIELLNFLEANRKLLEDAPLGLYAVVPTDPTVAQIQPGVIYCLRQKGETEGNARVNPLQPYFLVYVWDQAPPHRGQTVRYGFAQPKQILDIYRTLCLGQDVPYDKLCALFDEETADGADMAHYNALLQRAVASIARSFRKRNAAQLTRAGRGGVLIERPKQARAAGDFELVTWLVVKERRGKGEVRRVK
jgi:hypothetical protein